MSTKLNRRFVALLALLAITVPASAEPFAFRSGDRVALVGNTVIERAQNFGHLETLLSLAAGEEVKDLTFRNLGWSGDSVYGDARSYFGPPQEGRERLKRAIEEVKPTVLLVCYGTNAAMTADRAWTDDGEGSAQLKKEDDGGVSAFLVGYDRLLDLMVEAAGESLREVVLMAPPPLENLGAPLPDQAERNRRLGTFAGLIESLATTRGHRFVNLWEAMGGERLKEGEKTPGPLTTNGVHYGEAGYAVLGEALAKGLGMRLPGNLSANAPEVVALREAVVEKNRLFFHRWRPANETYLFLFRKHEQGQNAKEIPMFDPLIEEEEKKIEELRGRVFARVRNE